MYREISLLAPKLIKSIYLTEDKVKINVNSPKKILKIIKLKMNSTQLLDQLAKDDISDVKRFKIIYIILNLMKSQRIIISKAIKDFENIISISDIYKSAEWLEREIWDMFGIKFKKNKDLRKILTDYGFKGTPLRKEFPITGYLEIYFNLEKKKILYKPIRMNQEFRNYEFATPWI